MADRLSNWDWARLVIVGGFSVAVLTFFAYTFVFAKAPPPIDVDERNCTRHTPPAANTLILVDYTDAFSPSQAKSFRSLLKEVIAHAKPSEMVSIATIEDLPAHYEVSLCSPERTAPFTLWQSLSRPNENWYQINAGWKRKFEKPISVIADRIRLNTVRPRSPIIQTIDDAIDQLGPSWKNAKHRRLIIVSDLMENMPRQFSQYNSRTITLSFATVRSRVPYIRDARPFLKDADIELYYLLLPRDRPFQDGGSRRHHQEFWRDLVAQNGGRISNITDLPYE